MHLPDQVAIVFFSFGKWQRHSRFWKEPEQFQLLCCTFCLSNVRCTMVVCRIWQEPHHRVVYRLHRPLMVFPNFTLHETIFFLPPRLSLRNSGFYASQIICQMQSQFSILFLLPCSCVECLKLKLNMWVLNLSVSFLLLPIYIFTSYEQSSSRHVTLNY